MVQKIIFVMLILGFPAKLPDNGGERAQQQLSVGSFPSPPAPLLHIILEFMPDRRAEKFEWRVIFATKFP